MPPLKKPKVLTRLKISEVSSVDRGAGDGCKITLYKRDGDRADDPYGFKAIFKRKGRPQRLPAWLAKYARPHDGDIARMVKQRDAYVTSNEAQGRAWAREDFSDPDMAWAAEPAPNIDNEPEVLDEFAPENLEDDEYLDGDGDEDGYNKAAQHEVISGLADMLAESGASQGVTRENALAFLLHDRRGNSLVRRLTKARINKQRKDNLMNRPEELAAIAKTTGGLEAICSHVIAKGETSISEHELTKLISDNVARNSGESAAQAFSRVYCSDEGLQYRKAIAIAKGAIVA